MRARQRRWDGLRIERRAEGAIWNRAIQQSRQFLSPVVAGWFVPHPLHSFGEANVEDKVAVCVSAHNHLPDALPKARDTGMAAQANRAPRDGKATP